MHVDSCLDAADTTAYDAIAGRLSAPLLRQFTHRSITLRQRQVLSVEADLPETVTLLWLPSGSSLDRPGDGPTGADSLLFRYGRLAGLRSPHTKKAGPKDRGDPPLSVCQSSLCLRLGPTLPDYPEGQQPSCHQQRSCSERQRPTRGRHRPTGRRKRSGRGRRAGVLVLRCSRPEQASDLGIPAYVQA